MIIIIYSLKIGAGQQGRIPGTYNCPQYKIKCRNIKYRELLKVSHAYSILRDDSVNVTLFRVQVNFVAE